MTLADVSTASLTLAYACRFPAGTYQVGARVTASYPATAVAGRTVRPASLTLALSAPAAALAGLAPQSASVAVSARLAMFSVVHETSGTNASTGHAGAAADGTTTGGAAPAAWASLAAPPARMSAAGQDLGSRPLAPTAALPALKATRAGTMTVTAGGLALRYAKSSISVRAQAVAAVCALAPGQDATLATIAVHAAAAKPAAKRTTFCPPPPPGGLKMNPRLPKPPKVPRGSTVTHSSPGISCAYVVGYSDVRKLNGAALVGPGLLDVSVAVRVAFNFRKNYFQEDSVGLLDYRPCPHCRIVHALPPARATFLAFGFMPVSATLQLTEVGTINIYGVGTGTTLTSNTAWSLMSLHVSDVMVNGQPLDVGNDCRASKPLLIGLTGVGSGPQAYSLQTGGPLTGKFTIPAFVGCGVTENLDPLFTGTISGPGNFARFTQGGLCTPVGDLGCPPPIPKPRR